MWVAELCWAGFVVGVGWVEVGLSWAGFVVGVVRLWLCFWCCVLVDFCQVVFVFWVWLWVGVEGEQFVWKFVGWAWRLHLSRSSENPGVLLLGECGW